MYAGSKWLWSTWQASFMRFIHGSSLLSLFFDWIFKFFFEKYFFYKSELIFHYFHKLFFAGHPHLPHIKQDLDAVSNVNHHLNHHGSSHSGRAEKECKCKYIVEKIKKLNFSISYFKLLGLHRFLKLWFSEKWIVKTQGTSSGFSEFVFQISTKKNDVNHIKF